MKRIITNTWKIFSHKEMTVYAGHSTLYVLMSFVPLLMLLTAVIDLLPFFNTDDLSDLLVKILPDLDQIRDLIRKYGADRLGEVDPANYGALLKEAEELPHASK